LVVLCLVLCIIFVKKSTRPAARCFHLFKTFNISLKCVGLDIYFNDINTYIWKWYA
jgi:hypothetical protein